MTNGIYKLFPYHVEHLLSPSVVSTSHACGSLCSIFYKEESLLDFLIFVPREINWFIGQSKAVLLHNGGIRAMQRTIKHMECFFSFP